MTIEEELGITDRKIGIEIRSSLNIPPAHEIQSDIEKLRGIQSQSRQAIRANRREIEKQRFEQLELLELVKNPTGKDGITYDQTACQNGADRCDKHIDMFNSLIRREREKIAYADGIIKEIEERRCLSEKISRLTGSVARG